MQHRQSNPVFAAAILRRSFRVGGNGGKVAEAYRSLPEKDRVKACIVTGNYGEAGAIEFYGKKYGLPLPPLSGHNQYHVWGPGRFTGEVVISIGLPLEDLTKNYQTVQTAAVFTNPYVMPYENNLPVYVCRAGSGQTVFGGQAVD
jgi:hypothetical protein